MASFNPQKVRDFAPANAKPVQMRGAGSPQLGGEMSLPGNSSSASPAQVVGSPRLAQRSHAAPQQQAQQQFQPQGHSAPAGARPVAMLGSIHPASAPEGWAQVETHRVEVVGEGPDGTPQVATFDAEFPQGTRILGVRHAPLR